MSSQCRLSQRVYRRNGLTEIRRDPLALAEVEVRDGDHWHLFRTALHGVAGKVCQAAGSNPAAHAALGKNVVPTDHRTLTTY